MKPFLFPLLMGLLLWVCGSSALAERLPDDALKRAQKAEKQLKINKPREAIKILEDLDRDHPGHAAVSLRLGQIYDQLSEYGPALFYLRRYVKIAGDKALDETKTRLYTLELMAGAKEAAEEFGKKLGQQTSACVTPTPHVQESLARLSTEGNLIPVKDPKDLGITSDAWTSEVQAQMGAPAPGGNAVQESALGSSTPESGQPPAETMPPTDRPYVSPVATTRELPATGAVQQPSGAKPAHPSGKSLFTPPPMKEDSATQPGSGNTGRDEGSGGPPRQLADATEMPAIRPRTNVEIAPAPQFTASAPAGRNAQTPFQSKRELPTNVQTARATPEIESKHFFSTKLIGSPNAIVKITNGFPESVMTFAATPNDGEDPINAVLTSGESRTLKLQSGVYRVSINVTNMNYPPQTIFDTSFDQEFAAGTQYMRRISAEDAQTLD